MLYEFLIAERAEILALCAAKLQDLKAARSSSDEMERGLPIFYEELIEVLHADELENKITPETSEAIHRDSAVRRGKESLRLGYTLSQVVHGYGALCQSITEYAGRYHGDRITAREFNRLNFCLDVAIAEAVTEFNRGQYNNLANDEAQRLGSLAHEMRNALAHASAAHRYLKKGIVGFGGSTNQVLEDALGRMKELIDRSLSEVRLHGQATVDRQTCRVVDMVGEVEITAMSEASDKSINMHVSVNPELNVFADRHLVISAISNLVQNAIKFTKVEGNVWIRGNAQGRRVLIEVEDECGGLPHGKIEALFEPYTQKGLDKSGVGLGLSIARRAILLNDGVVSARDIPGEGCVFTIDLPLASSTSVNDS